MIHYRSFTDLNNAIIKCLSRFPHDIDIVVGIPRSGLLPAYLIALYLNKPLTDIDSFIANFHISHGNRSLTQVSPIPKKALIVDDSIFGGTSMSQAREKLKKACFKCQYYYLAIFAHPNSINLIDYYCEVVPTPRVFQWNLFHHPGLIPHSCFDIDGVLCENPPVDDDSTQYINYISTAVPKFIPTYEIDTIVSCRLEKYRPITEEWLKKNHVKYKHLVLLDLPSKSERIRWGKHGEFKGKVYKENIKAELFVESSLKEAKEIVKISRKPVFCTETYTMLNFEKNGRLVDRLLHQGHIALWKVKLFVLRHRDSCKTC